MAFAALMKNKDVEQEKQDVIRQQLREAMEKGDNEAVVQAFSEFAEMIAEKLQADYEELERNTDRTVLAQRGERQLTKEETEFYEAFIEAHQSGDPKQALTVPNRAMPETVIDSVLEDMRRDHELLACIDFINAKAMIKMIINTADFELATWDNLFTGITKELSGKVDIEDVTIMKLTAFFPLPKDMLKFGPSWVDQYIRITLSEAISMALERAILKGSGKKQPIGMIKDLKGAVIDGEYPNKEQIRLNSLEVTEYCNIIAPLAKKPYGGYRTIKDLLLVVNPIDYIRKIIPATTVRAADGTYKNNILPYPTKIIQSAELDEGEAVLGLAKRYFMAMGGGKDGAVEYSDEYQFLEDTRVYTIRTYGNGKPKDNNSFLYLDISGLKPSNLKVQIVEDNGSGAPTAPVPVTYTQEQLSGMTVEQIKELAQERGYTITATVKADIIQDFLRQQGV